MARMKETLRAAVVQMNAGLDKLQNLATAERLVREAANAGAELILLPELFNAYGDLREVVALAEPIPGPTSARCAALAKELNVTLAAGSLCEQSGSAEYGYNTSLIFGPDGELRAKYRKIHLFDVEIPGRVSVCESRCIRPGESAQCIATPLATLGQAICYDLRFPELFRALAAQQMEVLLLPSAFTATTGRDHWEVLVRARAIENQSYVLAANQYGAHGEQLASYGGSLIVDPWGEVLARAPLDQEAVLIVDLTHERLQQVRTRIPALAHRRLS
jgi:predicted amidohydrolase